MMNIGSMIQRVEQGKELTREELLAVLRAYQYLAKHHVNVENELMRIKGSK